MVGDLLFVFKVFLFPHNLERREGDEWKLDKSCPDTCEGSNDGSRIPVPVRGRRLSSNIHMDKIVKKHEKVPRMVVVNQFQSGVEGCS